MRSRTAKTAPRASFPALRATSTTLRASSALLPGSFPVVHGSHRPEMEREGSTAPQRLFSPQSPLAHTVIGTATVQFAPTGPVVGAVYGVSVPPVVRVTLKACGPPQLIPTMIRVYAPGGRIDCGMTAYSTGLLYPDLMWQTSELPAGVEARM